MEKTGALTTPWSANDCINCRAVNITSSKRDYGTYHGCTRDGETRHCETEDSICGTVLYLSRLLRHSREGYTYLSVGISRSREMMGRTVSGCSFASHRDGVLVNGT
jgi:hypothetical protein